MKKILVTKPALPELERVIPYFKEIWDSRVLTNSGPMHNKLETALCDYLGVKYVSLFSNATLGLMVALKVLNIKGEVITTPFSFVATAHSIIWNNSTPVFVDIEDDFNIDTNKIEDAITDKTTAIMAVHCYGMPCRVEEIEAIAKRRNLKVIYDAAHAFGVKYKDTSVLNYGDLSVLSFHATKVFNTFEGGAIVSNSLEMKTKIDKLKNFGFESEVHVSEIGINAKMNELCAAIGLVQLQDIDEVLRERKNIAHYYQQLFKGSRLVSTFKHQSLTNNSYYPVLIESEGKFNRDFVYEELRSKGIFARRYFYPLISDFSVYRIPEKSKTRDLAMAKMISDKVLCLPIYPGLEKSEQEYIFNTIVEIQTSKPKYLLSGVPINECI
jgi:dTDP-4-amino-4,6-dideoxygalactose transaminase